MSESARLSRTFLFSATAVLGVSMGLLGCGKVKTVRAPGGGHLITCNRGMADCVSRADKICKDKGYTIVRGASLTKILGGPSSSYQKRTETGELVIQCGEVEQTESPTCLELPARADEPLESEPSPANAARCVPGATQKCVGPGACDGGQICAADGSGFGVCDCGSSTPAAAQPPAAAPPPPAAAPASPDGPTSAPRGGQTPSVPGATAPAPAPL